MIGEIVVTTVNYFEIFLMNNRISDFKLMRSISIFVLYPILLNLSYKG
jgi:hypothetical protein